MPSEITGLDITVPAASTNEYELAAILKEYCGKWAFQEEKGEETEYLHFQVRCRTMKARYIGTHILTWSKLLPGCHVSPTTKEVHQKGAFNYVMKADTRTRGPWTDVTEPKYITRQLKKFMALELRPWQKKLEQICGLEDDRWITIILDKIGNTGKSIMAEYLEYNGLAYEVPPFTAMEDLMQCCMCIPGQKAYLIDMPRGMKKENLASFYAGIEALKNGTMYDKRYQFKKRRIDRPQIIVFTNTIPNISLLSIDRWKCMQITDDYDIIEMVMPDWKQD